MVKICPRRSYPVYEKDFNSSLELCPEGFDSIYYKDLTDENEIYQHRFRLYNKSQILPCYVIQFSFNEEHEK